MSIRRVGGIACFETDTGERFLKEFRTAKVSSFDVCIDSLVESSIDHLFQLFQVSVRLMHVPPIKVHVDLTW